MSIVVEPAAIAESTAARETHSARSGAARALRAAFEIFVLPFSGEVVFGRAIGAYRGYGSQKNETELRVTEEPENLVLKMLRDMHQDIAFVRDSVQRVDVRVQHVEKQLDDLQKVVTYTLGQSTEARFRQTQQQAKLDEMFEQLEKLLPSKEPT